jgi:hypothetical protein
MTSFRYEMSDPACIMLVVPIHPKCTFDGKLHRMHEVLLNSQVSIIPVIANVPHG